MWRHYYNGAKGVIFVVDSNDKNPRRIESAKEVLHSMLQDDGLRDAALLVLANKQDLPGAMSPAEVSDKLDLHSLKDRQWSIYACRAISGDGILNGLEWLSVQIKSMKKK